MGISREKVDDVALYAGLGPFADDLENSGRPRQINTIS